MKKNVNKTKSKMAAIVWHSPSFVVAQGGDLGALWLEQQLSTRVVAVDAVVRKQAGSLLTSLI